VVVVPFTNLRDETRAAVESAVFVSLEDRDDAYFDFLAGLWTLGETFVLVEHDIVPWEGAIDDLLGCSQPWCSFGYLLELGETTIMHHGLGCVKFSEELCAEFPSVWSEIALEANDVHPAKHWCNIDDRLTRWLTTHGAKQHRHDPPVEHLSPKPSHGCV
jgi:hypothetical protein